MLGRLLVPMAVFSIASDVVAQGGGTIVKTYDLDPEPLDLLISGDGTHAIVRTGSIQSTFSTPAFKGALGFIDLASPYTMTAFALDADAQGQDLLGTLGNYCIAVSGAVGGIYVFQVQPPTLSATYAGQGADVVTAYHATTGREIGVVRGVTAGLYAFDLVTPSAIGIAFVPSFTWGPMTAPYGTSQWMSDSVQASSSRVIAITNRYEQTLPPTPDDGFVGITDLDGSTVVVATLGFTCSPTTTCTLTHPSEALHDVAVTPSGTYGIAVGNGVVGVYRLRDALQMLKVVDHANLPRMMPVNTPYSRTVIDAVEATNTRAIVIGKDLANNLEPAVGQPDTATWRAVLVDLTTFAWAPYAGTDGNTRAYDVAITPNGSKAIVSTRGDTLVFDLTSAVTAAGPVAYPTATDPLAFPSGQDGNALVSDSVATTDFQAVLIGRNVVSTPARARVSVVDLLATSPASAVTAFDFPDVPVPGSQRWLPTDVAINGTGRYAVVRMVDLDPANGWLTSGRLVVIDLRTLQVTLDRTDAMPFNPSELGMAQGYDQVECSFNEVITAGEMAFQNGGMGNQEDGYVQLLRLD